MQEYFEKISRALQDSSLSDREALDLRLSLQAFMSDHPARLPWYRRFSTGLISRHASFASRATAFALVLVLVAGVGTSYAAEGSLPGNPLYGIKVGVDEPIERATVASSQSQTQWDITLANRRLEEAEELAAQKDLTTQNERIVQTQLDSETENFNAAVAAIATSSDAAVAVSNDQSDLEAALSAHVAVLSAIASSSPSVDGQIAPILAAIRTRDAKAAGARIAALAQLNTGTTTDVRIAASGEMQAAVSALSDARTIVAQDASTSAEFATDASDTQQTIREGDNNLAKGRFDQAFAAFQAAALSAQEAQDSAQAQENLGVQITLPTITATSSVDVSADATSTASTTDIENLIGQ